MRSFTELWPTLKRLLAYGSPWRKPLAIAVAMMWIAAAAEVSGPLLISYFIDNMVAKHTLPLKLVAGLAVAYICLQLLAALGGHVVPVAVQQRAFQRVKQVEAGLETGAPDLEEGLYGAGTVIVWDRGRWAPVGDARQGLVDGKLVFDLDGHKLHGRWELVRIGKPGERQEPWLLLTTNKKETPRASPASRHSSRM